VEVKPNKIGLEICPFVVGSLAVKAPAISGDKK